MKKGTALLIGLLAITLFPAASVFAEGGGTSANSPRGAAAIDVTYEVIPFVEYTISGALPPQIEAIFKVRCYQRFLTVMRHEEIDQESGEIIIILGGLVENAKVPCSSAENIKVNAGPAFSGHAYDIRNVQ